MNYSELAPLYLPSFFIAIFFCFFLQVSVVPSSMQFVMDRKEGIYKRVKKKLGIEVFTSGMKAFLQETERNIHTALQKTGYTSNNNSFATQENAKTTL